MLVHTVEEFEVDYMSEEPNAADLVGVLITKMESMDNTLNILKAENEALKQMINNPKSLIKKMGLVPVSTPLTADLTVDPFRGDVGLDDTILKSRNDFSSLSNEQVHSMSWEDIHEMAITAKEQETGVKQ